MSLTSIIITLLAIIINGLAALLIGAVILEHLKKEQDNDE
jgi:hypothetical protein